MTARPSYSVYFREIPYLGHEHVVLSSFRSPFFYIKLYRRKHETIAMGSQRIKLAEHRGYSAAIYGFLGLRWRRGETLSNESAGASTTEAGGK